MVVRPRDYIASWMQSPFGALEASPWRVTTDAIEIVRAAAQRLGDDYRPVGEAFVHASAEVEPGLSVETAANDPSAVEALPGDAAPPQAAPGRPELQK